PSTINKGPFCAVIDRLPLTVIETAEDAEALLRVISTPGTFPRIDSMILAEGTFAISSPFTETTDPVKSRFFTVPYPTTIISSNEVFSFVKTTVDRAVPLYSTWLVTYPTKVNLTFPAASLTINRNRPDSSVDVEASLAAPSNRIVTPAKGELDWASTTVPVISVCWA